MDMNPLQWLKAIYETFGSPYPRASLAAVMVLGAIVSGAVWLFAAKQVEKDRQQTVSPPQTTGAASASGNHSVANTGNGSTINNQAPPLAKPPKKE